MHGKIPLSIRVYSSSELVRDRKQESEQLIFAQSMYKNNKHGSFISYENYHGVFS